MQLAETLGIRAEDVNPPSPTPTASATTTSPAAAASPSPPAWPRIKPASTSIEQMRRRAAQILGVSPSRDQFDDGESSTPGDPAKRLTFKEIAAKLHRTGGPIVGRGGVVRRPARPAASASTSSTSKSIPRPARSTILRYTAIQDAGTAIHPSYVEGQMQGGALQGIGWALNEEYFYDDEGQMRERQLPRLPHADVARPADDRHHHRRGAEPGPPFGVRGVGEVPDRPPAPRPSPTPSIAPSASACTSCP